MAAQIEPVLQPDKVGALGDGRPVPGAGSGRRDGDLLRPAVGERLAQQRLGHWAAAGVAGANEENVHAVNIARTFRCHPEQSEGAEASNSPPCSQILPVRIHCLNQLQLLDSRPGFYLFSRLIAAITSLDASQ